MIPPQSFVSPSPSAKDEGELNFSPNSVFWRVNREALIMLASSRPLLLQIAHPLVAAGVAEHSRFDQDPFGRLFRTMRVMADLSFGTVAQAHEAARHMHRCHQDVSGELTEGAGRYPAGQEYSAHDPHLKLWVLATLIDSALVAHDLFVARLSIAEKESYYTGCRAMGRLMGVPDHVMPATYLEFAAYVDGMIASEELAVSSEARAIADAMYAQGPVGRSVRIVSQMGIGLLPPRIREGFGFAWGEGRERLLQRLAAFSRRVRPRFPDLLFVSPRAQIVEARWRGRSGSSGRADPYL